MSCGGSRRGCCTARRLRVLLAVGPLAAAGCVGPPLQRLSVRAEGPGWRAGSLLEGADAAKVGPVSERIALACGAGETAAFQIVLRTDGGADGVEITVDELTGPGGTIGRDRARLYVQYPVTAEGFRAWRLRTAGPARTAQFFDVLVPIDAPRLGQPLNLAPRQIVPIWAEVRVPRGTPAGRYESSVRVRSAGGAIPSPTLTLDVLPYELPATPDPFVLARIDVRALLACDPRLKSAEPAMLSLPGEVGDRARRLLSAAAGQLREAGVWPYADEVFPVWRLDEAGHVRLGWEDFDALIGLLIGRDPNPPTLAQGADPSTTPGSAGVGSVGSNGGPQAWPLPVDHDHPRPEPFGGRHSAVYARVLRETLSEAAAHFAERGWLTRSFLCFERAHSTTARPADADVEDDAERTRLLGRIARRADARLRLVSGAIPQSMCDYGWTGHAHHDVSSVVGIFAPPAQFQHHPTLERLRAMGRATWLVPDRPPFSGTLALEGPPPSARSVPWQAVLQGHEGVWLRDGRIAPADALDQRLADDGTGRSWLLYPGSICGQEAPIPSLRLRQLQLGIQDAAVLRMLERRNRGATARLLASSLIKASGTDVYVDHYQDGEPNRRVDDPAAWELAAKIAREELAASQTAGRSGGASAEDWQRFLSATRGVEVWVESVRMTAAVPGTDEYRLETVVSVRNELLTPVRGRLRFGDLPPDWHVEDTAEVERLETMEVSRHRLRLRAPRIAIDLFGHCDVPVRFEAVRASDGTTLGKAEVFAALSAIVVPSLRRAPVLDGSLGDWPSGEQNVIGDLRVVGPTPAAVVRVPAARREPARVPPRRAADLADRVLTYVGRNRAHLYLAVSVRAADGAASPRAAAVTNVVEYDDLIPTGEDVMEILLDPTNAGTESADIYHLVLKAGGTLLAERGIGSRPPIGERTAWDADIRYAFRRTSRGWQAEVAIPLSALPGSTEIGRIWGLNVARFDPQSGTYANWARAPRHCYNPQTFGNLVWSADDPAP